MTLNLNSPVVMAILNITPDSFYAASRRGGAGAGDLENAVRQMLDDGARIIDIGGYSSRPGAADVSPDEEFRRAARGIEAVRRVSETVPISVDTFRAEVARRVVEEFGECIINDISAGDLDARMIETVAALNVPYIAMHMRGTPADMQQFLNYDDITSSVVEYFSNKLYVLKATGIRDIIIDPGFGFAKSTEQNYRLMNGLHQLVAMGHPVLSGVSRKSMIYKVLDTTPAETLAGTTALNWESLRQGAKILRVHDVREAADVIKIFNKFIESGKS